LRGIEIHAALVRENSVRFTPEALKKITATMRPPWLGRSLLLDLFVEIERFVESFGLERFAEPRTKIAWRV
jgi:hypothetical protein